jgi:hypothetical protein
MCPTLFHIFIDKVIRQWQVVLTKHFETANIVLNTILLIDNLTIFSESEDDPQRVVNRTLKT